jgi:hypothetical protein
MRASRRTPFVLVSLAVLAALVTAIGTGGGASAPRPGGPSQTAAAPGSHARFTFLAAQHSNRCNLQGGEIMAAAAGQRLQGSCCTAMDEALYRRQVAQLRRYAGNPEIPRDPYDVLAALARQLLGYERTIRLTPAQQATYRRAMSMTKEHGPCCCRCWRWDAFKGLSSYLIARRGWTSGQLARLIEALDGCGGPDEAPAGVMQMR